MMQRGEILIYSLASVFMKNRPLCHDKKHSILLILLLLSFGFPEIIISSSASYYFRTLGINDGLSQSTVNAILQDRKGFMWIGTKDGLNQYDGQVFRTFQKENSSLGNNFITAFTTVP